MQSLCQILEASVNIGSRSLDVQLDALLGTLHPQVGVPWGWGVGLGSPWSGVVLVLSSVMGCEAHPALVLLLPLLRAAAGVAGSPQARVLAVLV